MQFLLQSPLQQFEVNSLVGIQFPILGYINFSLTNLGLYTILTVYLVISFHVFSNNNNKLIPNRWSISLESSFASLHSLVKSQIGAVNEIYLPFIYSLFFFILFANLNGNVPYGFTITTSIIVALGISVTIFLGVTILGLSIHKLHFFTFFVPSRSTKRTYSSTYSYWNYFVPSTSSIPRSTSFCQHNSRTFSYENSFRFSSTNVYKKYSNFNYCATTIYDFYRNCSTGTSSIIYSSICILYSNVILH